MTTNPPILPFTFLTTNRHTHVHILVESDPVETLTFPTCPIHEYEIEANICKVNGDPERVLKLGANNPASPPVLAPPPHLPLQPLTDPPSK